MAFGVVLALAPTVAAAQAPADDPWFGRDKALHFGASALLAGGGYGVAALLTDSRPVRAGVGAATALTAGIAKELFDLAGFGHPSWRDFTWDVIGAACGVLVSFVLDVWVISPLLRPAPQPM